MHSHKIGDLVTEAQAFQHILNPVGRILSLVPPHHLFGFIFTILLPSVAKVPVLDMRVHSLGLGRLIQPHDIIVATPFHWTLVERTISKFPNNINAVCSTAALPRELAAKLTAKGLDRIIEVYGSSETSGIGWRTDSEAAYELLPYWNKDENGIMRYDEAGSPTEAYRDLLDKIRWSGPRHLEPCGRKDGAVKIGGINVFPHLVSEMVSSHPDVTDCLVAAKKSQDGTLRLEATIVASTPNADEAALTQRLTEFCAQELKPSDRPTSFRFVAELARTSMGKLIPA